MSEYPNALAPEAGLINDYASAIGMLTIYWAALENGLLLVIEGLLETDDLTAKCVGTSLEKAAARATLIQRLAHRPGESPSPEWTECMDGLCNQITNVLGPKRNRLIHDDWMPSETAMSRKNSAVKVGKPAPREAKSLLQNEVVPSRVEDIWELTSVVVDTMVHISMLAVSFRKWKATGQQPSISQQAIRLSKGLPAKDLKQEAQ